MWCQQILPQQRLSCPLGVFSPSPHVKPLLVARAAPLVALSLVITSTGFRLHENTGAIASLWSEQCPVVGVVPAKADSGCGWKNKGLTLEEPADPPGCGKGGVGVCWQG